MSEIKYDKTMNEMMRLTEGMEGGTYFRDRRGRSSYKARSSMESDRRGQKHATTALQTRMGCEGGLYTTVRHLSRSLRESRPACPLH